LLNKFLLTFLLVSFPFLWNSSKCFFGFQGPWLWRAIGKLSQRFPPLLPNKEFFSSPNLSWWQNNTCHLCCWDQSEKGLWEPNN
jgi:hypothetical protein